MRIARIAVIMLVFAGMATFNPADAQLRKLRNKGKDKIEQKAKEKQREKERKLEAKFDKELDKAVEGAEDSAQDAAGSIFERKAEEMMAQAMGGVEEPFDLGSNESGSESAPFVSYRSVSKMEMAGMNELPDMFAGLMTVNEVHYIHNGVHRTDSRGSSTVLDGQDKRMINIQHADETYSIRSFDEMADLIANMGGSHGDVPETEEISSAGEMKISVKDMEESKVINNVLSDRRLMIIEGEYESTSNEETREGVFFFLTDAWISEAIAGHKTISDTNAEIAKAMGSAFSNTGNSFAGIFAMMENGDASNKMNEAIAELNKMGGGLAVKSDTYMIQAPKGATLDLDKVFTDGLGSMSQDGHVTTQQTVFVVRTNIGDLTTDSFELDLLNAPGNYTEIEYANPWETEGQ